MHGEPGVRAGAHLSRFAFGPLVERLRNWDKTSTSLSAARTSLRRVFVHQCALLTRSLRKNLQARIHASRTIGS
jgi:hypothetical protein